MSAFSDTNETNWRGQNDMWPIKRRSAEELDSILYFLSSALTSVIDESSYLAQHQAALPQIGAGLAAAEIASRLALFRQQVCDVSEREFVIVTKLARARHWAQTLRRYEPHLRADIDAFLAATARCETMARERTSDAQSLFDGQAQPKRFLADRVPGGRAAADAAISLTERLEASQRGDTPEDHGPSYLIGGEISVEALNDACETLLARMAAHYGWEDDSEALQAEDDAPMALDEPDADPAIEGEMAQGESGEGDREPLPREDEPTEAGGNRSAGQSPETAEDTPAATDGAADGAGGTAPADVAETPRAASG
jgi:hypothetical protein